MLLFSISYLYGIVVVYDEIYWSKYFGVTQLSHEEKYFCVRIPYGNALLSFNLYRLITAQNQLNWLKSLPRNGQRELTFS